MNKKYLSILCLLILSASIISYVTAAGKDYLPEMKNMADQGSNLEHISGQLYKASLDNEVIGYFDRQSAIGYAGPIEVLIFIGQDGRLKDVIIVKHTETPSFFNKVVNKGFMERLHDKAANDHFELGQDLDGVAGCTYTSEAIAEAVRRASHYIAVTQLNMEVPNAAERQIPLENYLILTLLLVVFVFQKLKWNKLRNITFLAGFLLIGYWQKSLLTLGNFSSVLSGNIPWQNLPFWLVLLFGILLLILITGRNLYCFWICPYGALSELMGAFGKFGRINYQPCERSLQRFKNLRLFLAWGALVFAFIMRNPSISSYEIFAPLFAWEGAPTQWLMLPVMLFTGIFIFRFWCRFFCPVGGILDYMVKCRRSSVQWIQNILKKKQLNPNGLQQIEMKQNTHPPS